MKKNWMKAAALCVAAVTMTAALASCGGAKSTTTTDATEAPAAGETLVMGTNAAFPPFEFVTPNGLVDEFDGIDVAIAKKIAEDNGMELKISDQEFDGLISAVSTGKIDFAAAGMTATDERRENVDFSDTYYVASQVIVVPEGSDIASAADLLNDKKVGVVLGYTGDQLVTEMGVADGNITRANRGIDVIQDVKNGKLDAVVIDSATGKALAEANGLQVVEDPEVFETEEYAIAVKKGNTELLDMINATLAEMKASGELDALAVQYDGAGEDAEDAETAEAETAETAESAE